MQTNCTHTSTISIPPWLVRPQRVITYERNGVLEVVEVGRLVVGTDAAEIQSVLWSSRQYRSIYGVKGILLTGSQVRDLTLTQRLSQAASWALHQEDRVPRGTSPGLSRCQVELEPWAETRESAVSAVKVTALRIMIACLLLGVERYYLPEIKVCWDVG